MKLAELPAALWKVPRGAGEVGSDALWLMKGLAAIPGAKRRGVEERKCRDSTTRAGQEARAHSQGRADQGTCLIHLPAGLKQDEYSAKHRKGTNVETR